MTTKLKFSFEFFPPKTEELNNKLWDSIKLLESLSPVFVSVTYGAGGTTRERTHEIVKRIRQETKLEPASHLTCVNATKAEIDEIAKIYWDNDIKHIVALRGDPPGMVGDYVPTPGGYQYASDLVAGLKKVADFEISVAAYPEVHPTAKSAKADLEYLKLKLDNGADRAITQFFFNADDYFCFVEAAQKIGITKPIIPGILPIANFTQAQRFANMCGAKIPAAIAERFEDNPENKEASLDIATELCEKLVEGGIDQLHIYTLNRADLTSELVNRLK